MSCLLKAGEREDVLMAHVSGRLTEDGIARLRAHISSCVECAAVTRTQSAIVSALNAWQPPPVTADFDQRLFARIEAAESASWFDRMAASTRDWLGPLFARPALPLAAAAFILILGFVLDHSSKSIVPATSFKAEQVEATVNDLEMLHQFEVSPAESSKTRNSM